MPRPNATPRAGLVGRRVVRTIPLMVLAFVVSTGQTFGAALQPVEVGSLNATTLAADAQYIYGVSGTTLIRLTVDTHVPSTGFNFGSGHSIWNAWTTSVAGEVFALIHVGSSGTFNVYRSTDYGASFSHVLALGATSAGQIENVRVLHRGFAEVFVGGSRMLLIGEYNVNKDRTPGATNDPVRLLKSTDGTTWSTLYTFNQGAHHTRHIHAVRYDPRSERIYFALGDGTRELGIIGWDGTSPWPSTSMSPNEFTTIPGFKAATGEFRFWVTDLLFPDTDSFVYAGMEGSGTSYDEAEKGIWRHTADLSHSERVYPGPTQGLHEGPSGQRLGVLAETANGLAQVWVDVGVLKATSNNFLTLYVSGEDNFVPGAWAAYLTYPTVPTSTYVVPSALFAVGRRVYLSAPRRLSDGQTTSRYTAIYEVR
jgi:hypothetical protein